MKPPGVRADDSHGDYNIRNDRHLRELTIQIGAFFFIVFASGKLMGYLLDKYLFEGASQIPSANQASKMDLIKGQTLAKQLGITTLFKSEVELADEFSTIKELTPKDLKMNNFFSMNRNYFI